MLNGAPACGKARPIVDHGVDDTFGHRGLGEGDCRPARRLGPALRPPRVRRGAVRPTSREGLYPSAPKRLQVHTAPPPVPGRGSQTDYRHEKAAPQQMQRGMEVGSASQSQVAPRPEGPHQSYQSGR